MEAVRESCLEEVPFKLNLKERQKRGEGHMGRKWPKSSLHSGLFYSRCSHLTSVDGSADPIEPLLPVSGREEVHRSRLVRVEQGLEDLGRGSTLTPSVWQVPSGLKGARRMVSGADRSEGTATIHLPDSCQLGLRSSVPQFRLSKGKCESCCFSFGGIF